MFDQNASHYLFSNLKELKNVLEHMVLIYTMVFNVLEHFTLIAMLAFI